MKKKQFKFSKTKKKFEFKYMLVVGRTAFRTKFNSGKNFISFLKQFSFLNISTAHRACCLFGIQPGAKFNIIKRKNIRIFCRIMSLKFYFNYALIKELRWKLLKTLVTFKMIRFYFSFPLRGQRTKINARTRKKYGIL